MQPKVNMSARRRSRSMLVMYLLALMFIGIGLLLYYSRVSNEITSTDERYILRIMEEQGVQSLPAGNRSFEEEVAFIKAVQQAVMHTADRPGYIPEQSTREPGDLYERRYGVCYDLSRVVEKMLRYNGFKTRHISIFQHQDGSSALRTLSTRSVLSHALTEVFTQKGWLFVDSREPVIGLNAQGEPIDLERLREEGLRVLDWDAHNVFSHPSFFDNNYLIVYGLYSRHGQFYPPYNMVPDINWQEFIQNF